MKQKLLSLLAIVLILLGQPIGVVKAVEHSKGLDIVFVVDDSASMKETDPNRLAGEAVRRFVDLLPAEGDKLGIVTYSYDPMASKELTLISSQGVKDEFKKFSLAGITQEGRNTDTGTGLLAGGQLLDKETDSNRRKAIVLITDGENDFRGRERTQTESDRRLEEFLSKGYPVYTIGVNPQTDSFKQYLTNIATVSKGKVWFPKTSEELNNIIKEVAVELGDVSLANSDIVSVSPDKFTAIKQTIPQDVLEANIQIDHEEPIQLELVDAGGQPVSLDSQSVLVYTEEKYTNIKLLSPKPGDWTLGVKSSTKTIQVKVDWIYSYDVEIALNLPKELKQGKQEIFVTLGHKGKSFSADQYAQLTGELIVTNKTTGKSQTYPLTIGTDGLVADIDLKEEGKYSFQAQITGEGFNKSSSLEERVLGQAASQAKPKKDHPIWLKAAFGLVGLGLIGLLILIFTQKKQQGWKLSGNLELTCFEGGNQVTNRQGTLPLPSKQSRINLAKLMKNHGMSLFLEGAEQSVILEAKGNRLIELTRKKGSQLEIKGLTKDILKDGDVATLTVDRSKTIQIRFK